MAHHYIVVSEISGGKRAFSHRTFWSLCALYGCGLASVSGSAPDVLPLKSLFTHGMQWTQGSVVCQAEVLDGGLDHTLLPATPPPPCNSYAKIPN